MLFYIKDLSIQGLWYPQGSWNRSLHGYQGTAVYFQSQTAPNLAIWNTFSLASYVLLTQSLYSLNIFYFLSQYNVPDLPVLPWPQPQNQAFLQEPQFFQWRVVFRNHSQTLLVSSARKYVHVFTCVSAYELTHLHVYFYIYLHILKRMSSY